MADLYDEDGNPVKAFTEEEVEKIREETGAEFKTQLEAKEQELVKEREKEKNFQALRGQNKELTEEQKKESEDIKVTIANLESKIEAAKNEGVGLVTSNLRDSIIEDMSGGDEDLRKAIKENYAVINKPEGTRDEIAQRVKDAYLLSLDTNDLLGGVSVAPQGPGRAVGSGGGKPKNEEVVELGRKFGISDDDWNKYSK